MRAIPLRALVTVALALSWGCQGPMSPAATDGATRGKVTRATPKTVPVAVEGATRVVSEAAGALARVQLIGKVKLLSDKGAGIISNNTGNLVSNNGGGLIADKGASYRLAAAPQEALLAEARLEVLDGDGNVLVDAEGQPIGAVTDETGSFELEADLPAESLVVRVKLFPNGKDAGGALFALLHKDGEADRTFDVDTATTLGTAYVLEKYVKNDKAVLAKLPADEARALAATMAEAAAGLAEGLSYRNADLVAAAEKLRAAHKPLAAALERIEAILLAGQTNQGTGLAATRIPLGFPLGVAGDAAGNLYVLEQIGGRVRKVAPDGTVSVYAGSGSKGPLNRHLGSTHAMRFHPDGGLLVQNGFAKLVHMTKDGRVVHLAGTGKGERGAVDVPATSAPLQVLTALAVGPDGLVYLGEEAVSGENRGGRILFIDAAGTLRELATPGDVFGPKPAWIVGLEFTPDGALWVLDTGNEQLLRRQPGGAWEVVASGFSTGAYSRLTQGPDGQIYLSESLAGRVWRLAADGTRTLVAGTGANGYGGDGGPATSAQLNNPSGMWIAPDGALFVADAGNALVRRIGKDGVITTVAGTRALTQVGDALSAPINGPGGLAMDDQGRLILTEVGSHTIKRLENGQLTTIAGTARGFSGDGGPATAAAFDFPTGVAFHGGALWVLDGTNNRLRKIDASGVISTMAGSGGGESFVGTRMPALEAPMGEPIGLAFGPDGLPYWSDNRHHSIYRLTADGFVERLAGPGDEAQGGDSGDGGPAIDAKLNRPTGLAFDAVGHLYVADTGNLRIRRITPAGVIEPFAGLPVAKLMTNFGAIASTVAKEAALFAPAGICFDAAGTMYFTEMGTTNFGVAGGFDIAVPVELLPTVYPRLRKVTPDGKLVTVTGPGTSLLEDPESDDSLQLPTGLLIDKDGRLVIADTGLNQIKVLPKGSY